MLLKLACVSERAGDWVLKYKILTPPLSEPTHLWKGSEPALLKIYIYLFICLRCGVRGLPLQRAGFSSPGV